MPNIITLGPRGWWERSNRKLFTANKAEQKAFHKLWVREASVYGQAVGSYRDFRRNILYDYMNGCYSVVLSGTYIGIENDGYTHS